MKPLRILSVCLSLVVLLALALPAAALEYGDVAPDFSLQTLKGETVQLSQYKGKTIILKLATTWCPTCKQQMEEIAKVADFLDEKNVVVLDVFLQDTKAMVDDYLTGKKHPKNFVPLLDDGQARKAYNVYLIPRLVVIDPDFKVRRDGSLIMSKDLMLMINGIEQGKAG